jgi:hypothetical protein
VLATGEQPGGKAVPLERLKEGGVAAGMQLFPERTEAGDLLLGAGEDKAAQTHSRGGTWD